MRSGVAVVEAVSADAGREKIVFFVLWRVGIFRLVLEADLARSAARSYCATSGK
jgi:hypothetical protein